MPDGILNKLLGTDITWLGNRKTALICVVVAHVWMWIGYSATIYMSNLQSISSDILEAADIDGASRWQKFKRIILPMLAPATTINITLAFTQSLKVFDIVYAMTNGGPLNSTETVGTYVVVNMNRGLHGYASALTVLLTVVIVVFGQGLIGILKNGRRRLRMKKKEMQTRHIHSVPGGGVYPGFLSGHHDGACVLKGRRAAGERAAEPENQLRL